MPTSRSSRDTQGGSRGRRSAASASALSIAAALLTAASPPSAAATPGAPATPSPERLLETPDAAAATAAAAASGQRVEVLAGRGERQQLFARPEGGFTLEQSSEVRRVLKEGTWQGIDTTLRRASDGSVRPGATAVDLQMSGGGTSPLVRVGDDGAVLSLTFPAVLPVPTLDGDTATYAEVLPGVDLEVRAHPESFTQVLVVKTPEAARLPALRSLRFGTATTGGTLDARPGGGFTVTGDRGEVLMDSPEPFMWDSASTDHPAGEPADPTPPEPGEQISDDTGALADQHAPAEGDRVEAIATAVVPGALVLTPPADMLTDPDLTFPVRIDPTVQGSRQRRAMVNRTYPTTSYENWPDADQGVGYNSYEGVNVKRLFWQFDTSAVKGRQVTAARFSAFQTFAATCAASRVRLWRTGSLPVSTTWNTQPAFQTDVDSQTLAAGRPSCNPGGAWVDFNAITAVQPAAAGNADNITLALRSDDETTNNGWKRFTKEAVLSIDYNTAPSVPQPADLSTGAPATPCDTGAARPAVGGTLTLRSVLRDADTADQLTGLFTLTDLTSGTATTLTGTSVGNGATSSQPLDAQLVDGHQYAWQVSARDAAGAISAASPSCEFTVDRTAPGAPAATSEEYPSGTYAGGIGRQGWFVFNANGGNDVAGYWYAFDSPVPDRYVAANGTGGQAAVPFRPGKAGPHYVTVRSADRAGNRSDTAAGTLTHRFFVTSDTRPVAQWEFDGDPQPPQAAVDDVNGLRASYGSPSQVAYVAGFGTTPADRGVRFNNAAGCAATAGTAPVLPLTDSFTVAAKVRVTDLRGDAVTEPNPVPIGPVSIQQVVTVDRAGAPDAALALGYDGPGRTFSASLRAADGTVGWQAVADAGLVNDRLLAPRPDREGWFALAAVFDRPAGQLRLYVDGELAATSPASTKTPAGAAAVRLACAQSGQPLDGTLDDVRLWALPLPRAALSAVASETSPSDLEAPTVASELPSGQTLASGGHVRNGTQDLWLRPDGNLVLTGADGARWSSGTASPQNAGSTARMDGAGALLLQPTAGGPVTLLPGSTSGTRLVLTASGALELRSPAGTTVSTTARPSTLTGSLQPGKDLRSPNALRRLLMQPDGNLVLSGPSGTQWSSGTAPDFAGATLSVSTGNLRLTAPDGRVATIATGQSGARLELRDDGSLLLTAGGLAVWGAGPALPAAPGTARCAAGGCLFATQLNGTGSGRLQVQGVTSRSGYQTRLTASASAFGAVDPADWRFFLSPLRGSGAPDLFGVRLRGGGSGKIEVHVLSAASGYQTFTEHAATAHGALPAGVQMDIALAGHNGDGQPNLYLTAWGGTGSGQVEVHVLSAATTWSTFLEHAATALPTSGVTAGQWRFLVGDAAGSGDLVAVRHQGTGSGTTEVHVMSRGSGYQAYTAHVVTAAGFTDDTCGCTWAMGNADDDAVPDVVLLLTGDTGSGSTEVHALGGNVGYSTWTVHAATGLPNRATVGWQHSLG